MAARLSEDPATRVVLLEAGGHDRHFWIHVPLGYGKTITDPRVNWCYETEPEPNLNGRRVFWPRGKVLGGSSSINGLVYIRGQKEDFDQWRQLGNTGWSFDDVLPYFRRAETPDAWRERSARRWRAALCVRHGQLRPDQQGIHQGRARAGLSAQRRLQRPRAGRRRLLPAHHAQRPSLFDRGGLSAPGDEARQSARHHQCADRAHHARRSSRHRRDVPPGRPTAHRARLRAR